MTSSQKVIDQKEYLKRYLSGSKKDGKKKKRPRVKKPGKGLNIVDDNLDHANIIDVEDENDLYELAENAPQVAGVFDDRPIHIQAQERFFGAKWKSLATDEDRASVAVGKDGKDSASPSSSAANKGKKRGSDSDVSPPRKSQNSRDKDSDGDFSPPRRRSKSPQRKKSRGETSPKRGRDNRRHSKSPPSRGRRKDSSPPRKNNRRGSDSDASPPRRGQTQESQSRRDSRPNSDSKHKNSKSASSRRENRRSPPRRRDRSSDSDLSPARNSTSKDNRDKRRKDNSPPRRGSRWSKTPPRRRERKDSDSDLSPPRVKKEPVSPPASSSRSSAVQPVRIKQEPVDEAPRTLEGKRAGLQDARSVKAELMKLKAQEKEHFKNMSDHISGRGAQAVFRDRRSGRKRDLEQEQEQNEEEKEEERKKKEEFAKLGRGLVQAKERSERLEEALHEAAKPVARYAGDEDLERHLKDQEREGDPMLDYLRAKRRKDNPVDDKPVFRGPEGPPNRFNIRPGHKWDGVDRSTGYEKKLFASINAREASKEEAYKWSVADM